MRSPPDTRELRDAERKEWGDRRKSRFKHLTIDQESDKIEGCLGKASKRCLKIEVEIKVMCEAKSIWPVLIRERSRL
jgi:hypothetical protein